MDRRYIIIFLTTLVVLFVVVVSISVLRTHSLGNEFPELSYNDSVNDTVLSIMSEARATARVTLKSGRKVSLPWAKNHHYEIPNLPNLIKEGDVLIKRQSSDTIIVRRGNLEYLFVANRSIEQ